MGDHMKLAQFIVTGLIFLGSFSVSAQSASSDKTKSQATAKKGQSRSEFYDSVFKMYKAHKQELKELQVQFINKQMNQDIDHQKSIIEIQKQINPKSKPESNKTFVDLLQKKNKEFQASSKAESEQFYAKVMAEKSKQYSEKASKMIQDYEGGNK